MDAVHPIPTPFLACSLLTLSCAHYRWQERRIASWTLVGLSQEKLRLQVLVLSACSYTHVAWRWRERWFLGLQSFFHQSAISQFRTVYKKATVPEQAVRRTPWDACSHPPGIACRELGSCWKTLLCHLGWPPQLANTVDPTAALPCLSLSCLGGESHHLCLIGPVHFFLTLVTCVVAVGRRYLETCTVMFTCTFLLSLPGSA